MPHVARKKGESRFYHVVLKGIRNQTIFLDDADRSHYIELLRDALEERAIQVVAYCLMSNHIHFIFDDPADELSALMKQVNELYAMYYAKKTGRTGGIFIKPFWSETIENESYLLCAVRYVHANPAAAGICRASAYEWSSVKDYLGRPGITSTSLILEMLGGRDGFVEWSNARNATATPFPGSRLRRHIGDDEAACIARDILGFDASKLAGASLEQQRAAIVTLRNRGLSARQIMRISGLGRYDVERHL